jgi:hypothetical protein
LRHRLLLEEEVVAAATEAHGLEGAEKFVQEVCWRTYWKGWLETRPRVWESCLEQVGELSSGPRPEGWERATAGETGIECFDAWARELVETGYLHNHARMWFASIWVFTLGLSWPLGADFFMRHLLDGDPASNTLSWRWVAGLQTRGKTYLATPDNIARYTEGRFRPGAGVLATAAPPIVEKGPDPAAAPAKPDPRPGPGPVGLLLTEDDLTPETLFGPEDDVVAVAGFTSTDGRSPLPVSEAVRAFTDQAMDDALGRAGEALHAPATLLREPEAELAAWAREHEIRDLVTPFVPVGPARSRLERLRSRLAQEDLRIHQVRRRWDEAFWPQADRGFFRLKKRIGKILRELSIAGA